MRSILIVSAVVLASTCSAFAEPKFVSKDGFVNAIIGKVISSKTAKGNPFTATFKADGTGDFQQKGKKPAHFDWAFEDKTVCWDFGDFKECNKVEIVSSQKANFYDAKTGKLNNAYSIQ